ncbi:hypothetical protein Arth_3183 [Arthrobacter sp. FB24]|jgi:hypothetical protein|uniref:DUF6919 domain-containing protein n=1 Tax=Arthrobacter sp. (strain FB24) TaxID=290399 RepID=UPI000052734F|nr:hypothetical protein [Arthrobacter sp. FB24]ABK04561.1 hypothetical protein Arth_3183 [Arthrobacter sp. FB24]
MFEGVPDEDAWRNCTTLEGACELTARWLEGTLSYVPGYAAPQYAGENGPMSEALAAINRLGFLTDDSQPGAEMSGGHGQRAFVTGRCTEQSAAIISAVLVETDLVVLVFPPGESGTGQICVTLDGAREFTWLGSSGGPSYAHETYTDWTNETLAKSLAECWELQIFDPVWGRNTKLVPLLQKALITAKG